MIDGVQFYHPDHVGTNAVISTPEGEVQYAFHAPFGELDAMGEIGPGEAPSQAHPIARASLLTDHLFTDQEDDALAELDAFGARHYDPWVGRFWSQDPEWIGVGASVAGVAGNSQMSNSYAYVLGRPTVMVDPDGRLPWWCLGCTAGPVDMFTTMSGKPIDSQQAAKMIKADWPSMYSGVSLDRIASALPGIPLGVGITGLSASQSGGVPASADHGGGFWSNVADVVGKIWNLPNTIIGAAYGLAGMMVGAVGSLAWGALHIASLGRLGGFSWFGGGISFANGQIQFTGSVLQRGFGWVFTGGGNGAITLGDVGIYPPGFGPGTVMDTASGQTLGIEESFHSQQGRILGPAYLPANIIGGVLGVARNGYWHGPANFMERGPHMVPPRRF